MYQLEKICCFENTIRAEKNFKNICTQLDLFEDEDGM